MYNVYYTLNDAIHTHNVQLFTQFNARKLYNHNICADYPEEQMTVSPEEMRAAVTTPVFQPYRGETGRAWVAKEYGVTMDTSSFMSSETEREETDDEILSFDLGPEPYEPG